MPPTAQPPPARTVPPLPETITGSLDAELSTVDEVATLLERLEAHCLPVRDHRGVFATAYLQITRAIRAEIEAGGFQDPRWATAYLVRFGDLYRRALLAYESGRLDEVPKSWRLAFDAACEGRGLVLQHLLLGINAHINHDLALALTEVGIDPERERKYSDHVRVNEVLDRATEQLKSQVSMMYAPLLERIDWLGGRLDDDLVRFSIPRARDHAWGFAVAIAGAKTQSERALLYRSLDEQAAVLAQLILAPPTNHPIVLRVVEAANRVDRAFRSVARLLGRG